MSFPADVLALVDRTDEVDIQPASTDKAVTIWVVVADGAVYVRSVKGTRGRWYRKLLEQPDGELHVDGRALQFTAHQATDPETVQRVSEALRTKYYGRWPKDTDSMLLPDTLPTTLRLDAR